MKKQRKLKDEIQVFFLSEKMMTFLKQINPVKKHFMRLFIVISLLGTGVLNIFSQDIESIKNAKPFSISGSFGISSVFYNIEGRTANREPFSWTLTGSPTISVYGISFPFSFTVSEQERNFNQPFNQYGVSPAYKWVKLHLGYSNMQFSPYTLGGHSVMGAGFELNPGRIRAGFIYGRFLRPVPYNDTITITPSYKRNGFSAKIGYGTGDNYLDLILLNAKDIEGSIEDVDDLEITPAENVVWSAVTNQKITGWLSFSGEFAQSVYTEDISIDSASSVFGKESTFLSDILIHTNSSTVISTAIDGNLLMSNDRFSLGVHYKRLSPGYKSMGAYYFQSDVRNITVEPGVKLMESKLSLNGSFGFQTDNLDDSAAYRTNRTIGSAHVMWQPSQKYQADVLYSNYDLGQKNGIAALDTLTEISQTTSNISVNQTLSFVSDRMSNNLILSFNHQKLKDHNSNTASDTEYSNDMLLFSWYMTHIRSGLTTGLSFNYTTYDMAAGKNQYYGPSLSVTKSLLKQKLNLSLSCSGYRSSAGDEILSTIIQSGLRGTYRLTRKHKFQIKYLFNRSIAESGLVKSYTEHKGEVSYVYSF